jgi:hypothetical protein
MKRINSNPHLAEVQAETHTRPNEGGTHIAASHCSERLVRLQAEGGTHIAPKP